MELNLRPIIRFLEVLPKSGDLDLGVLKCHLLIEEVLSKLIERSVAAPEHIVKARLTFAQKICVARSVCTLEIKPWVWTALSQINRARNELGHGLSSSEIKGKVDIFTVYVEKNEKIFEVRDMNEGFAKFHCAAFSVYAAISVAANFDPLEIRTPSLLSKAWADADGQDG